MCQSLLRPEDLKICLHVWTGKFKDYYVTSLFLFLNISVVFFPGRVNGGIPGKLGMNVITSGGQ